MARILESTEQSAGRHASEAAPPTTFVGRSAELRELRAALDAAEAGSGSLTLVSGEAGAGKTTICGVVAAEAARRGFRVVWGRAWESGGAPAYWPWTQALRTLLGGLTGAPAEAEPALARLLPELDPSTPPAEGATDQSPEGRFALYDAVRGSLARAASDRPLLMLLDDVHAADPSSVLLLSFLSQQLGRERIAVLATHRDPEYLDPATAASLAEAAKQGRALRLRGLDEREISDLALLVAGAALDASTAEQIRAATEGNPFFVGEVVRELADAGRLDDGRTGGPLPLPAGVREAVRRRIQPLGADAGELLEVSSVMGREFSLAALAAAANRPRGDLLDVLDRAAAVGLVAPVGSGNRWRFAHAIVYETLYAGIAPAARIALHRRVADAVEELYAGDADEHVSELARHYLAAAPAGEALKGISYARRAAAAASAKLAWEDAALHLERALEALELTPDRALRLELLLELGGARQGAGDTDPSRQAFEQAAMLARQLQLPDKLADAALGRAGIFGIVGDADHVAIDLLTEALTALGDADPVMRVQLQSRLALELRFTNQAPRREALVDEALASARELDRDDAILFALSARYFITPGTADPERRLRDSSEAVKLGERLQSADPILIGAGLWRATNLIELGDVEAARLEVDQLAERATRFRLPWASWRAHAARGLLALVEGDLETAERFASEALAMGQPIQGPAALQVFGGQLLALRLDQGRLEEIEPAAKAMVAQQPNAVPWRATLALIQSELERQDDARRQLDHLAQHDFRDLPDNDYLGSTLAMAAGAAAYLRDEARCRLLYDLLEPFDGRCIVAGYGTATLGPARHWRGVLAAAIGRADAAAEHFEAAIALERLMGARPYLARTELEWARLEAEQGKGAPARERAEVALALAREVGMPLVSERAGALLSVLADTGPGSDAPTGAAVFRREGELWTVGLPGRTIHLRDSKGLAYIRTLLVSPGQEVHALELVTGGHAVAQAAGDAGAVLDDEAKRAYRERVAELQSEIAEAEEWRDPERAARAREELEFVAGELAAAVGLGGRDRRAKSDAERARVNVTRAIRSALKKIEAEDPELAQYLAASVKTGTFCSYSAPRSSVTWQL